MKNQLSNSMVGASLLYIDAMVERNQKHLEELDNKLKTTRNEDVKSHFIETRAAIAMNLERATEIQLGMKVRSGLSAG